MASRVTTPAASEPRTAGSPDVGRSRVSSAHGGLRAPTMPESISHTPIPPAQGKSTKTVMVKKRLPELQAPVEQTDATPAMLETKKMKTLVVSRRIRPGETLKTLDGATVTMPTIGDAPQFTTTLATPRTAPSASMLPLVAPPNRPRVDASGQVVARTVLGDADEFREMSQFKRASALPALNLSHAVLQATNTDDNDLNNRVMNTYRRMLLERERATRQLQHLDENRRDEQLQEEENAKDLLVHEKIERTKQTKALANWEEHNRQWAELKQTLATKLNKPVDELVLSRIDNFREVVEERAIVERAMPMYEPTSSSKFWPAPITIGNPVTGVSATAVPPKHEPVERVRRSKRTNLDHSGAAPLAETWTKSQYRTKRLRDLKKCIDSFQPASPDFDGLEIVATSALPIDRLRTIANNEPPIEKIVDNEAQALDTERSLDDHIARPFTQPAPPAPESPTAAGPTEGPSFKVAKDQLYFEVAAGVTARATLRTENNGTTAIFYRWRRLPKPNPLGTVVDSQQRFYFHDFSGKVLPGDTYDFSFVFKSPNAGVYYETWELETSPVSTLPNRRVRLKGVALLNDVNASKRKDLENNLERRVVENDMRKLLQTIINNIRPTVRKPAMPRADPAGAKAFHDRNLALKLYYTASLYNGFTALAADVALASPLVPVDADGQKVYIWDSAVTSLDELIFSVPDEGERAALAERLNHLINAASVPPTPVVTALTQSMAYDMLISMLDEVPAAVSHVRAQLNLPPKPFVGPPREEGVDSEQEYLESTGLQVDRSGKKNAKKGARAGSGRAGKTGAKSPSPTKGMGAHGDAKKPAAKPSSGRESARSKDGSRPETASGKPVSPRPSKSVTKGQTAGGLRGASTKPTTASGGRPKSPGAPGARPKSSQGKTSKGSSKDKRKRKGRSEDDSSEPEEDSPDHWNTERHAAEEQAAGMVHAAVARLLGDVVGRFAALADQETQPWEWIEPEDYR